MLAGLPLPVLKEYLDIDVTKDYVNYVKAVIDNAIEEIAIVSYTEFNELNELRALHNLRQFKRLSTEHFNTQMHKIINISHDNIGMALKDGHNKDTSTSKAGAY